MSDTGELSKFEGLFVVGLFWWVPTVFLELSHKYSVAGIYYKLLIGWVLAGLALISYQHRADVKEFLAELREEFRIARRHGAAPYQTEKIIEESIEDGNNE